MQIDQVLAFVYNQGTELVTTCHCELPMWTSYEPKKKKLTLFCLDQIRLY